MAIGVGAPGAVPTNVIPLADVEGLDPFACAARAITVIPVQPATPSIGNLPWALLTVRTAA